MLFCGNVNPTAHLCAEKSQPDAASMSTGASAVSNALRKKPFFGCDAATAQSRFWLTVKSLGALVVCAIYLQGAAERGVCKIGAGVYCFSFPSLTDAACSGESARKKLYAKENRFFALRRIAMRLSCFTVAKAKVRMPRRCDVAANAWNRSGEIRTKRSPS